MRSAAAAATAPSAVRRVIPRAIRVASLFRPARHRRLDQVLLGEFLCEGALHVGIVRIAGGFRSRGDIVVRKGRRDILLAQEEAFRISPRLDSLDALADEATEHDYAAIQRTERFGRMRIDRSL